MGISRKACLLVALAMVAALVMAAPVYASQGDSTWTTPSAGAAPHTGYTTTTNKCVVCHAAHAVSGQPGQQLLLRTSKAEACTYCHITTTLGVKQVYGGVAANYNTTDFNNAHNSSGGVACNNCHQVHGAANAMTANAYLSSRILRSSSAWDPNAGAPLASEPDTATAMTKWCSGCHGTTIGLTNVYYAGIDVPSGTWPTYVGGHTMKSYSTTYTVNGTQMQVAWANSTFCSSCHAAGYQTSAWPHYVSGAARFLTSGGDVASATAGAAEATDDGVCLRCHRGSATSGVGLDF